MGFILLLLAISVAIGLFYAFSNNDMSNFIPPFLICGIISTIVICIVLMVSYESTIDMKQRVVNVHSYRATIKAYIKTAKSFKSAGTTEYTDLKYQDYQEQVALLLKDLRNEVVRYNNDYIGKKAMNQSFFWYAVIFESPPGAHELKMQDYLHLE